ncbi:uncharacterized protein PHACADRAFT_198043 [Phanerochaete carnosa HHB-10118-sp]|uniref:Uncharacterized protein n=1 Tax=Phanerochaete carnosa (strain HHB-10118-sp) TaxID=650164 RepID=K5WT55_PHACS|nr:uncharacterized protein PHACADRAFT_198043 [Phanerochaete carnosa HHB-10118-sp]EKM53617.1 hypothetical protein PHACADRAFT_198043 [Phanerochaete carnosa HHB-10118-sp]
MAHSRQELTYAFIAGMAGLAPTIVVVAMAVAQAVSMLRQSGEISAFSPTAITAITKYDERKLTLKRQVLDLPNTHTRTPALPAYMLLSFIHHALSDEGCNARL